MIEIKNASKTVGIRQTIKAAENDELSKVLIADDVHESVIAKLLEICRSKNIEMERAGTMKTLGSLAGIDVGACTIGLKKKAD